MNVLLLTHRLPYAPNRGDRIRAFHLLNHLGTFATVSLFSLVHDDEEASSVRDLRGLAHVATARVPRVRNYVSGAVSLLSDRPLTHTLLHAPGTREALDRLMRDARPDVVVAYCSGMARLALEAPLNDIPFVLDMVDVDSAKWRDLSHRSAWPMRAVYMREARTLGRFEVEAARHARMTLVVNEREAATLEAAADDLRITVVPNGIEVEAFRPRTPPSGDPVVVFCGVLDYAPNEQGVLWFARNVWPRVRAKCREARFVIVGSGATAAITALSQADGSIVVTGRVAAVQVHLWQSALAIAPLAVARGVQNKVLEAVAAGLPVVVTPAVAEGLPPEVSGSCRTADTAEDFANAVLDWLALGPMARRGLATASDLSSLAWPRQFAPMEALLRRSADTSR